MLKYTGDEDLLMTSEAIRARDLAVFVRDRWRFHTYLIRKKKRREAAVLKIQSYYRMYFIKNSSFVNVLKLK